MNPVLLIAIGAGGAVLGVIIGMTMFGKGKELEAARKQLEQVRRDTSAQLEKLKAGDAELRKDLESTKARAAKSDAVAAKAEESATKVRADADQLKVKLKEAEGARDQAKQQAQSLQAAQQQAEGRAKQAEKLVGDATGRLAELESELATAHKTITVREQEVARARSEGGSSASGLEESIALFADAGGSLELILEVLLANEDQSAAVLADSNGIVVAAAGDRKMRDGIAAAAQLMTRIGAQFEGMIPFGVIRSFDLRDAESKVIAGRATTISGEVISVATYGRRAPAARLLDGAIASLSAALS